MKDVAALAMQTVFGLWVCGAAAAQVGPIGSWQEGFFESLKKQAEEAGKESRPFVEGRQGWLFLAKELEALSKQAEADGQGAFEAVIDFQVQLKAAAVELLLVPVPFKAALYAEKLAGEPPQDGDDRLDAGLQALYRRLQAQGIDVVDLMRPFAQHRQQGKEPLYCRTDSHWSGKGIELAAQVIGQRVRQRAWAQGRTPKEYFQETVQVSIRGDLERLVRPDRPAEELLKLRFVRNASGRPPGTDRDSPVLLMGDSHCLVFHDPSLHAAGAGLPDHLAAQLGFPVDLLAVRGSGANATRLSLRRRRDNLEGKRLVIWCLAARELVLSEWKRIGVFTQRRRDAEGGGRGGGEGN